MNILKDLKKSIERNELSIGDFAQNAKMVPLFDTFEGKTTVFPTKRAAARFLGISVPTLNKYQHKSRLFKNKWIIQ